jgi:hypothetical protein
MLAALPRMLATRGLALGRALLLGAGTLGAVCVSLAVLSAPAYAVVEEVEGAKVGLQPREIKHYWEGAFKRDGLGNGAGEENPAVYKFANNPKDPGHPGPVLHSAPATYMIYWDPQDYYHSDWQGSVDSFMANMGSSAGQLGSVFAVDTQYSDTTGRPATSSSIFHGSYTDTTPYPESEGCVDPHPWELEKPLEYPFAGVPLLADRDTVCLTDAQIKAQLKTFIAQHGLQTGMGTIFYMLTPPGVTVCLGAGGATGRCSDFDGTLAEIAGYEEEKNTYPERFAKYIEEYEAYETENKKYEAEKENDEKKAETDTEEPPVEPVAPTPVGAEPSGYADYRESFCSYHSAVTPTNPETGDANTILYAVIPWIAGGEGDYHVALADETSGFDCQDGGFAPNTKPKSGELEEKEQTKIRTPKEQEEFEEKTKKEKREIEEAKELGLDKPHEQEPNQLGSERGPDGSFDEGLADLITNQIAVEQQDIVTDPLLNAWQDPAGEEVTDECRNSFYGTAGSATANPKTFAGSLSNQSLGEGKYYLNDTFNLASFELPYPAIPCLHGISLAPKFTAPNPVNASEVVGFDGMESDITLNATIGYSPSGAAQKNYAIYTWNFGDGSDGDATPEVSGYAPGAPVCETPWLTPEPPATSKPPGVWIGCAASAFHQYQYGGTFEVTLTVTDTGGHKASVVQSVTVVGPNPPSSGGPGSGGPGGTNPGTTTGGSGGPGGFTKTVPGPTATATAVSSSLKQVARSGLLVRYSVNEQVAGRFEVLLNAATAHRLGIGGPPAANLPAGSPRSLVIGRALLVTTKGGHSSVRIKLGKSTTKHLRRMHRVTLMLRLIVRNASAQNPIFTTVLSTFVLHG